MKIHKWLDRRLGFLSGASVLVLGIMVPAFVPAFASADVLETRSIQMSSSQSGATGVKYELNLSNVPGGIPAAGGLIIDFCSNGSLIGTACTAPSGMDVGSGLTADSGTVTRVAANTIEWVPASAVAANGSVDVTFSGITNPAPTTPLTSSYTFYARITTYATSPTGTGNYTSDTSVGSYTDSGGIALAIANQIGVTAYVMETMTFCVSGAAPAYGCTNTTDPSQTLGEEVGTSGVYALQTGKVSTGTDWAQLSTNASQGAVVDLKSSTTGCGGLEHFGDNACGIAPQASTTAGATISPGDAEFGLTIDATGSDPTTGTGTSSGALASAGNYSSSNYYIDYTSGDASGVTSSYGSPLFNSASKPVSNKNISFTFGASTAPDTPAGKYSANLNLIATGTF